MAGDFFTDVTGPIAFGGLDSTDPLTYKVYEPDRLVLGKRMADHLRPGVCFWHSFAWPGTDMFGIGHARSPVARPTATTRWPAARQKMAAAFEFFTKIGVPFYCFHDRDVAPEGRELRASSATNLDALTRRRRRATRSETGVRLLWGTANLFSHPRYQAGAATNPDPEVFAYAAAQVKHMLEVTKRLGGENYVLWGGREGYDTLLNTDLAREGAQLARFLHLVAEHKHRIGFTGQLLIEPKPMEPTKHQYDYDVGDRLRLPRPQRPRGRVPGQHRGEPRDARRAQLPPRGRVRGRERHPRQHRRQPRRPAERLGHGPVPELGRGPGPAAVRDPARTAAFAPGGFNFDAKLRRQSIDRTDLFHAHIGGLDTLAQALLVAADLVERGRLAELREARYAGWDGALGTCDPRRLRVARVARGPGRRRRDRSATRCSGGQELLENSSTSRSGRSRRAGSLTADVPWSSSASTSRRPRPRPSSSSEPAPSRRSVPPSTGSRPQPLWSEQDPALWWERGTGRDPGRARKRPASTVLTSRRSGSPARCTAWCCSTRAARPPTGDPLERPADGRGMRRYPPDDRAASGSSRSPATTR